jgi:hypothetical protein
MEVAKKACPGDCPENVVDGARMIEDQIKDHGQSMLVTVLLHRQHFVFGLFDFTLNIPLLVDSTLPDQAGGANERGSYQYGNCVRHNLGPVDLHEILQVQLVDGAAWKNYPPVFWRDGVGNTAPDLLSRCCAMAESYRAGTEGLTLFEEVVDPAAMRPTYSRVRGGDESGTARGAIQNSDPELWMPVANPGVTRASRHSVRAFLALDSNYNITRLQIALSNRIKVAPVLREAAIPFRR